MKNTTKLISSIEDVEMNNEEILEIFRSNPLYGHLAFICQDKPQSAVLPFVFRSGVLYLPMKQILLDAGLSSGSQVSFSIANLLEMHAGDSCIASVICSGRLIQVPESEQDDAINLFADKYEAKDFIGSNTSVFAIACENIRGYLQLDERL